MDKDKPFVSVVISAFNDAKNLDVCLQRLEKQTYPKSRYEVIVVDNNSTDNPEKIVKKYKQAKLTHEKKQGVASGRNKGIKVAKGPLLAFTDTDCIPALNWLEKGTAAFLKNPNCGLAAGKIEVFPEKKGKPNAFELYNMITYLNQERYINKDKSVAYANIFTSKKVFEKVGFLNEKAIWLEDLEWGQRVFAAGYKPVYVPEAIVKHPARKSFSECRTLAKKLIIGSFEWRKEKFPFRRRLFKFLRWVIPPTRSLFRLVKDKRVNSDLQKIKIVLIAILMHYYSEYCRLILLLKEIKGFLK